MKVLIADDESVVLEGLKYIIDWDALGFTICSQASNGEETLNKILNLRPELVLLDIRMPRLSGIEIIQIAREKGFDGHFIILSGYSDFTYAQTAIRYGVDFYLTKPIDEDELISAVTSVRNSIEKERTEKTISTVIRKMRWIQSCGIFCPARQTTFRLPPSGISISRQKSIRSSFMRGTTRIPSRLTGILPNCCVSQIKITIPSTISSWTNERSFC